MTRRQKILLYTLILSSYLVFFGSMLISARSYFAGKPIELKDALISYLLSATDNPHGYRIASAGISVCGALLLPVAFLFLRALSQRSGALALVGALLFGLGPLSAVSMIFSTGEINDLHVFLAFATYIFMTTGLLISLALEGQPIVRGGGIRGLVMLMALLLLLGVLILIICLLFNDDLFEHAGLLGSVAFDEWLLCGILAAGISGLAVMVTRPTR